MDYAGLRHELNELRDLAELQVLLSYCVLESRPLITKAGDTQCLRRSLECSGWPNTLALCEEPE